MLCVTQRKWKIFRRVILLVQVGRKEGRPKSYNRSNLKGLPSTIRMIPRPSGTRDTGPLPQMRQPSTCSRHLTAVQDFIVGGMENFFYNYGKSISTHPFLYIILCLAVTAACGAGLMKFKPENTGIKLWIPEDSSQRYVQTFNLVFPYNSEVIKSFH